MLPYTSQTAEKVFFFGCLISCSENIREVPGTCQWWSAMLVKLQAFIPQFN